LAGVSLKGNIPAIRLYLAANGPDGGIADHRDSNSNSSESSGDLDTWLLATRQGASISSGPKEKLKDALASLNFLVAEESMQAFTEVTQHHINSPHRFMNLSAQKEFLSFFFKTRLIREYLSLITYVFSPTYLSCVFIDYIGETADSEQLLNDGRKALTV
jgi:hypothetical protein